jgi:hypothetical protein
MSIRLIRFHLYQLAMEILLLQLMLQVCNPFPMHIANGVPLGTESVWGWHSFPNTENLRIEEAQKSL